VARARAPPAADLRDALRVIRFFRPAPDAAEAPAADVARLSRRWRIVVFLSITLGYTLFYVTRLPTSVSKTAMIEAGTLTIGQIGIIDTIFLWTYGIGKTVNGFLADRLNVRRFFATALLVSAGANLLFGASSLFGVFIVAWAVNGWVQSVGVPVSGVVMARWFPPSELGTRYSMWSMAHHLGEGLTFLFTSRLIGVATLAGAGADAWRAAFFGPALLGLVGAFVLYRTLADRPAAVGLPPVAAIAKKKEHASLGVVQREVLANPWILLCGVASALVYVTRYALNGWGVFYLQKECGYSIESAGATLAIYPITGIGGTLLAGPISDRLFGGRRVPVAAGYGVVFCISLATLFGTKDGVAIPVALACVGFAMGGLLVFLGGLLAMELSSKRAAGAALGVIGGFSYLGAGLQSLASSWLIERGHKTVGGIETYDFTGAKTLWIGAPILALVLTLVLWPAERRAA
jgi:OPA family sugar phosphate sensor protein UhpC-like MFS transporter